MNQRTTFFAVNLLILIILSGCGGPKTKENLSLEEDFKTVEVEDLYTVKIPNYMRETTSLNDEARFQASNLFKEAYSIVIDENKEEYKNTFKMFGQYDEEKTLLENYSEAQVGFITENLELLSKTDMVETTINGRKALMIALDTKNYDIDYDVSYFLTFVEGEENIYMMMNWTLKNNKSILQDTYNKIANSLDIKK